MSELHLIENISEYLQKLDDLLATEDNWTQEAYARASKNGVSVGHFSPEARCFCLDGAARRSAGYIYLFRNVIAKDADNYYSVHELLNHLIEKKNPNSNVVAWNDNKNRTFAEVKALIQEARDYVERSSNHKGDSFK